MFKRGQLHASDVDYALRKVFPYGGADEGDSNSLETVVSLSSNATNLVYAVTHK